MAGLSLLLAAAAFAGWQSEEPVDACARNFTLGELGGLIAQLQVRSGPPAPIRYTVWRRNGEFRMEWWDVRQDAPSLDRPWSLHWEFDLVVPDRRALWARFWADGVYLGQTLLADQTLPGRMGGNPRHRLSLHDRGLLGRLMRAEAWELEIVTEDGAPIMRRPIPAPPVSALRASLARETAWLAEARVSRPSTACQRMPSADDEI